MAASESGDVSTVELPVCIIVLGMAGSGKTTFVNKLVQHLTATGSPSYTINLDPAVYHVPYHANIDIRDTVKYKEVMKQYGFGPNGAIMTSLNFFTAHFDKVMQLITKNVDKVRYVVIDTPGQIEVFTWSASGVIISEALAASFPTVIVYVMDTPRSHNPVTFMSNMLYACSILFKMKLPFICVFNKTDIIECDFAIEWMRDFESFQTALSVYRSAGESNVGEQFDSADGPGFLSDSSQYMSSLTSSMSLVLDEFYNDLKCCGVSAISGSGFAEFVKLVSIAKTEYETEFLPAMKANKHKQNNRKTTSLLNNHSETEKSNNDNSADDKNSSTSSDDEESSNRASKIIKNRTNDKKSMLIDLVGNADCADSDPLVNLTGVEIVEEIDDQSFKQQCSLKTPAHVTEDK